MRIEVQAAPGEVADKIGPAVEGLLTADGLSRAAVAAIADAAEAAAADHVCQAGCAHHRRLQKGRRLVSEDPEAAWWPHPEIGPVVDDAKALAGTRAASLRVALHEAMGLRKGPLGLDLIWRVAELVRRHHQALAVQLFGADALPSPVVADLERDGILTQRDRKRGGVLGALGRLFGLGAAKARPEGGEAATPTALAGENPQAPLPAPEGPQELRPPAPRLVAQAPAVVPPAGPEAPLAARPAVEPPAPPPPAPPPGAPPPSGEGGPPDESEPPTPWQEQMAAAARRRGGALIVGLGNKVADDMTTTLISSDDEVAQERRRRVAEAMAEGAASPESVRQTRIRVVEDAIGGEDYARDMDRIVTTEALHQVNEGFIGAIGVEARIAVIVSPGACRTCRTLYQEDGAPRLFTAGALPPSSTNFRKKVAEWVATVPPLHPWCKCTVIHVPEGWTVDIDGPLSPEPTGE